MIFIYGIGGLGRQLLEINLGRNSFFMLLTYLSVFVKELWTHNSMLHRNHFGKTSKYQGDFYLRERGRGFFYKKFTQALAPRHGGYIGC